MEDGGAISVLIALSLVQVSTAALWPVCNETEIRIAVSFPPPEANYSCVALHAQLSGEWRVPQVGPSAPHCPPSLHRSLIAA